MPHDVIMPALGMAQETGLLVAWHKSDGDQVNEGDILFDVETDKSTMEVEAQHTGYLVNVRATAGMSIPVGQVIAKITENLEDVEKSLSAIKDHNTEVEQAPPIGGAKILKSETLAPKVQKHEVQKPPSKREITKGLSERILASPKVRRIALERNIDLSQLHMKGFNEPFHMSDLEKYQSLHINNSGPKSQISRIATTCQSDQFKEFTSWISSKYDVTDEGAILACFAGASFNLSPANVLVDDYQNQRCFEVASLQISQVKLRDMDDNIALQIRDLRVFNLSEVDVGGADVPVLTLLENDTKFTISLEYQTDEFNSLEAINILSEFVKRMEMPLLHLV